MTDKSSTELVALGKYGQMAMGYMQEFHPARLSQIIVAGHMAMIFQTVDQEADEMLTFLIDHAEMELPLPDTATDEERTMHYQLIRELCEAAMINEVVNRKR